MRLAFACLSLVAAMWCASLALAPHLARAEPTAKTPTHFSSQSQNGLDLALAGLGEASVHDAAPLRSWQDASGAPTVSLMVRESVRTLLPETRLTPSDIRFDRAPLEFSVSARTIIPELDIGIAQRASARDDDDSVRLLGREFRLGDLGIGEFKSPTWDNPQWYIFAANDDGAVTWTPAARRERTSALRVQEDRVTIGDFQAGVSIEANGMQAALSYIKRDASNGEREEDASFTGLSLTWRR